MGVSTNAVLFYGYCWDEEIDKPWNIDKEDPEEDSEADADDDWEDRYAQIHGIVRPTEKYPDKGYTSYGSPIKDYTAEEQAIVDKYSAYFTAKYNLTAEAKVSLDFHCSDECRMPYVLIKESELVNYRGSMTEVLSLEVKPEWAGQLAEFCKVMGIDASEKEAAWWLVSWWS